MTTDNSNTKHKTRNRFNIRAIAFGVISTILVLVVGEAIIWQIIGKDDHKTMIKNMSILQNSDLSMKVKTELKQKTIKMLIKPSIIATGLFTFIMFPLILGFLTGLKSISLPNAPLGVFLGFFLQLIGTNALSVTGFLSCFGLALLAFLGSLVGLKFSKKEESQKTL